jgi:gliding motility-associated-like protein
LKKKTSILLILLLSYILGAAQSVDFTFTTSNNLFCAPQSITFTQTCTGNPDGFIWSFGNGSVGSNATETITYLTPGTYTISLTATFSNNAITTTKTIVVNATPTISVSVDRNYICQPGNILFIANGSAGINSYEWNFGDGTPLQTTATNSITHNFNTYNNFTVTVKGTTASGCFANTSINVQVTKFPINASVTPNNGCIPSLSNFVANINLPIGDVPLNYVWTFGDGAPNATTNTNSIPHTFNITTPITTASVLITSAQGCTNQYNFPTFAFGTPPFNTNAFATALRDTFCGSETIGFKATATNANLYNWDFGDGNSISITDSFITHKYDSIGNKQIIVRPSFNGCFGQPDTINIVLTGVIAVYTFANQCNTKNTFNYNNISLGNISSFRWTFSDNPLFQDNTNYNISHTFPTTGSFTTKLYVYDAITGCSDSLSTYQYTATPNFTYNKSKVCKDSAILYTVLNTYDAASGFSYDYNVNGILFNNGPNPVYSFSPINFGTFNDFVVIKDPSGNTCNDTIRLSTPTIVQGPVVNFSTIPQQCSENTFPIINTTYPFFATDSIVKWQWTFGDNTKDSIRNPPPHKYSNLGGAFTINLIVTDTNKCAQSFSQNVTAYPMPQIKSFPKVDTLCLGQTANLYAYTVDTLLWTPNVNIACNNCDTTTATPLLTTPYIAQATNSFGCISRDTSLLIVYQPINLSAFPMDTFVCPQKPVVLSTNVQGVITWSPSTYLNATVIPNPISTPDTTITYTVRVADSIGCFADTATVTVHTFPKPIVNAGPDTTVAYNSPFAFNPQYIGTIASYTWSPFSNNLTCTNCAAPNGVARITENYEIAIISNDGCKAIDSISVFILCDEANLYVPTAFTPNGDGVNDLFCPIVRGYKIINKMVVYNRWGNKVFERNNFATNQPALGWTGFNGANQAIETDAFVWYIEATCDAGQKISAKGTVVLIR